MTKGIKFHEQPDFLKNYSKIGKALLGTFFFLKNKVKRGSLLSRQSILFLLLKTFFVKELS